MMDNNDDLTVAARVKGWDIFAPDWAYLAQYPDVARVGVCFMHMFQKAGWLERISFDLLIDATVGVDVHTE